VARSRQVRRRSNSANCPRWPARRTYIPKADGTQRAVATVLGAIYEEDFVGFSYGFRPGRGQHDALDALHAGILRKRVNWVLNADIRGFYDAMAHAWIIRFLEHRIADKRILRLIAKWLKVGIIEDGRVTRSQVGAPQGAVMTPWTQKITCVFDAPNLLDFGGSSL
jgi:RNA-directed DNA polymerase